MTRADLMKIRRRMQRRIRLVVEERRMALTEPPAVSLDHPRGSAAIVTNHPRGRAAVVINHPLESEVTVEIPQITICRVTVQPN